MYIVPTTPNGNQYPVNEIVINGTSVGKVDDKTAERIYNLVVSKLAATPTKTKAKTFDSNKAKAKDITVSLTAKGKVVTVNDYVGKDVFAILKARLPESAKYTKGVGFEFKTAKQATEFAKNNLVTATEREALWSEWSKAKQA